MARTPEELHELFCEQTAALQASCHGYDQGHRWEAKRIATAIYILCHDPPIGHRSKSKSLLGQMGAKGRLHFVSTADPTARHKIPSLGLIWMAFQDGTIFVPGGYSEKWMPFRKWYEEPVFFIGLRELSRKNLILSMRSQDGGAHVDEVITNAEYQQLRLDNDVRVRRRKTNPNDVVLDAGVGFPMDVIPSEFEAVPYAHFATVRQIGSEVLQSVGELAR